jgi:hypothetical protein
LEGFELKAQKNEAEYYQPPLIPDHLNL